MLTIVFPEQHFIPPIKGDVFSVEWASLTNRSLYLCIGGDRCVRLDGPDAGGIFPLSDTWGSPSRKTRTLYNRATLSLG